jgi:dipeptidyl aminopeptidase/acylaminoacyl peptidase
MIYCGFLKSIASAPLPMWAVSNLGGLGKTARATKFNRFVPGGRSMSRSVSRRVRWWMLIALYVACVVTLGFPEKTWAASAPLLMQLGDDFGGDIFSYSASGFKNLTGYGYNGIPILSPDGRMVAYSSYARIYVTEQFGGQGRSGPPSTNIWIMDVRTGSARRVADQPADNRTKDEGRVRPFITRSDPRWSPDGKFLIWMEQAEGTKTQEDDQNEHLILYRLSGSSTTEIYKQSPGGIGSAPPVEWNTHGISVISISDVQEPPMLRILDSAGKLRSQASLEGDSSIMVQWLNGESSPTIITRDELVDLAHDTHTNLLPPLEIYSLSAPNGLRLISEGGYFGASWTLVVPGEKPLALGQISDYAIAPDGKMAAYVTDDHRALYIFDGKKAVKVALNTARVSRVQELQVHGLAWSRLGIRIHTDH